jgi:hypothetical protein
MRGTVGGSTRASLASAGPSVLELCEGEGEGVVEVEVEVEVVVVVDEVGVEDRRSRSNEHASAHGKTAPAFGGHLVLHPTTAARSFGPWKEGIRAWSSMSASRLRRLVEGVPSMNRNQEV